ncbi:unnamed protein product [Linum tenue]|uniref:Dirigent protein n=1 Tax=Linum tenue TaxID=586396 RepID=A0AAV0PE69_9ROSI|nr:unnamed protein product [Linum tenue]
MARLFLAILIISMAATTPPAQAQAPTNWAKRLNPGGGPESITNLQFYFHDIPSGQNPSAVQIVKPATSTNSFFGMVMMTDDALTVAVDAGSKLVGRAQGMYTFDSQTDLTLLMAMSFGFTDGPYNGSSLVVVGRNPILEMDRELPVLGGTGRFRMARGYALVKTVSADANGNVVVYYNVTVHAPVGEQAMPAGSPTAAANALNSSSSSPVIIRGNRRWMVSVVVAFAAFKLCFAV